jgi:TatD DNase family protein
MLVDTHCHLYQIEDVEAAMRRASEQGVRRVVVVSEDAASMRKALDLRAGHPGVLAGLGLHPALVNRMPAGEVEEALNLVRERLPGADVLGEAGLDFKVLERPGDEAFQREVLSRQLDAARAARKPVNLHSRRALRETLDEAIRFRRETGLNAQMHWFTQSRKLVRKACEAGIYVSVGPAVLDRGDVREVCREIADDLLLLETDSPVPFGEESSEPSWLERVARVVAEVRGADFEAVAALTSANFDRFLGRA